jgi:hypothetical protein
MTTAADIRVALLTRLNSLTPGWETAWENAEFDPRDSAEWQRASVDYADVRPAGIGGGAGSGEIWRGHLIVQAFVKANTGAPTLDARIDTLMDHFPRGTVLTSGATSLTTLQPFIGSMAPDKKWFGKTVWVPWFCHANL